MAEIIEMPKMSDTMTEGVIVAWHKNIGDKVKSGELLAEVATDKATMELESYFDGVLLHRGVEQGNGVPVGALLAVVGKEGEDITAIVEKYKRATVKESAGADKSPAAEEKKPERSEPVKEEVRKAEPVSVNGASSVPEIVAPSGGRIKASPLAKALAKEKGVQLEQVRGSGEGGRIIKKDIDNFKQAGIRKVSTVQSGSESFEEVSVSQMRKTIARRLGESKFSAPHFYLTMEIDMDRAVIARNSLNEVSEEKISYNDLVVKAAAAALRRHPEVNASWLGDKIRYNHHIHIGVAVAVSEGLMVPVVRFADSKGLIEISRETRDLAGKAKQGKLQPQDWEGNTFTISNLGMFGIDSFTAIINPPDACIMAVGGISQQPVVRNGQIVPGHIMKVTLSCDHRVVDGAVGAAFLQTFKSLLEDPVRIIL